MHLVWFGITPDVIPLKDALDLIFCLNWTLVLTVKVYKVQETGFQFQKLFEIEIADMEQVRLWWLQKEVWLIV